MKLLIDIPQEIYEMCVKYHQKDYFGTTDHVIRTAIAHGSSLQRIGHWRDTGSGQECSECGEIQYGYDSFRRYCANCGSKNMEE